MKKSLSLSFVFLLSSFFLLPLSSLPFRSLFRLEADRGQRGEIQYGFTTDYYTELFVNRRGSVFYVPPIQATVNSLGYAGATVILSLLLGFPAALALAKPTRLERILDPLIMLPLGSSAVMLGLGFIISYGAWLTSPFLFHLRIHSLPCHLSSVRFNQRLHPSLQRLRQAASSLGASPFEVWKNIDLPILRRATLAAATFAFTISLGEFGATLLISRPEYPTIPVAIERFLSQPGGLNYGQAMAMATILMAAHYCKYFADRKISPARLGRILMLEVQHIFKTYEGKPLLNDISFNVGARVRRSACLAHREVASPRYCGSSLDLENPDAGLYLV